jgi:hypothetical protein
MRPQSMDSSKGLPGDWRFDVLDSRGLAAVPFGSLDVDWRAVADLVRVGGAVYDMATAWV